MAIDSREKRASATSVGIPWRGLLPLADAAIGQADRQEVSYLYTGTLSVVPVQTYGYGRSLILGQSRLYLERPTLSQLRARSKLPTKPLSQGPSRL